MAHVFVVSMIVVLMLWVLYILTTNTISSFDKIYSKNPKTIFIIPTILYSFYITISASAVNISTRNRLIFLAYLFIPALIAYFGKNYKGKFWITILIALCLWLPFDFRLLSKDWSSNYSYGFPALASVILGLFLMLFLNKLQDTKYNLEINFKDWLIVLPWFCFFGIILVSLGSEIGFIQFKLTHDPVYKILLAPLGIFFSIALPEEIIFRGIIQNTLSQKLKKPIISLLITAAVFGVTHLNNGSGGWSPLLWNWNYMLMASIAGILYGILFHSTKSIFWPILIHTLVDFSKYSFLGK